MRERHPENIFEPIVHKILFATAIFILPIISGCSLLNEFKFPAQTFKSKFISSYKIKKIALLPIIPDTKDSSGTYNATDYFNDLLVDSYPDIEFSDVDDLRKYDISFLPDLVEDVGEHRIMSHKKFIDTDIGNALQEWNCDAILLGKIDSSKRESGWLTSYGYSGIFKGRKTNCYFSYYLISMKDGRVLWKCSVRGSELYSGKTTSTRINPSTGSGFVFPPLDAAMVGGIELMTEILPDEIFKLYRGSHF